MGMKTEMGYPHDLLAAAHSFRAVESETQATLRRSLSTAYYALFHLLIEDACTLWIEPAHRSRLSRQFDHRRMKDASALRARSCEEGTDLRVADDLAAADSAFQSWARIREDGSARDYLFSLLFRDRS